MPRGSRAFALLHLVVAIIGTVPLLWYSDTLDPAALVAGAVAVLAVLWLTGAVMQGRMKMTTALLAEASIVVLIFVA
jgi:hypothetical protein